MTRPTVMNTPLAAYVLLTLTMLFWAGNYTVGRWASGNIPPVTLSFLRWTGAALLMLPFVWSTLSDEWETIRKKIGILLVLGVTGSGLFNTLQYIALTDTTATNAGIINSSAPIMIVLMSFALNREVLSLRQISGVILSTLGVLCILSQGTLGSLLSLSFRTGDVVMLSAMVIWAIYTVLLVKRPVMSALAFAFVIYAIAALLNAPLSALELLSGTTMSWTAANFAAVAYTAIFPSFLAYLFYNRGVEILGPGRASPFMHLVPVFTILFSAVFLGEQFAIQHALGLTLILAGIYLAAAART